MTETQIIRGQRYTNERHPGVVYLGAKNWETGEKFLVVVEAPRPRDVGKIVVPGGYIWKKFVACRSERAALKPKISEKTA